jgi:alkylhydroperoxidase family enzyme
VPVSGPDRLRRSPELEAVSRLALVPQSTSDPIVSEVVAMMRDRGVDVPNLYMTLAHAPRILRAWIGLTWPLRNEGVSPRGLRELAIMNVAYHKRCVYEWAHHWPMAIAHGITEEQLERIVVGNRDGGFDDTQGAVLQFTDDLARERPVSGDVWDQMSCRFSPAELIELTLTATFYINLALLAKTLEIPLEANYERYARRFPSD